MKRLSHAPGTCRPRTGAAWSAALSALLALCAALVIVLLPAPAIAAADAAWQAATVAFRAAAAGQADAADTAAVQWRALSDARPDDAVARAYAGAATALLARTTMLPWRKLAHVDDGLALLDKALAQAAAAPDAVATSGVAAGLEVRFVAASTFLGLPAMFNRGPRGARLLAEVSGSPQLGAAPPPFQAAVWLRAGDLALAEQRRDDARRWFERAAASGTPQAAVAATRLKSL